MNLKNRISECRKYEVNHLPRILGYLHDSFRGIRRELELQLDREREEFQEKILERDYAQLNFAGGK